MSMPPPSPAIRTPSSALSAQAPASGRGGESERASAVEEGRATPWWGHALECGAFAGVLAIYAAMVRHYHEVIGELVIDDVYIYLRYARNMAEGYGLVYNHGEAVEGYTSFLWTVMLGGVMALGAPPLASAQWLGVVLGALTLLLSWRAARRLLEGPAALSLMVPLWLATSRTFAIWAVEGMEVKLFGFTMALALWCWARFGLDGLWRGRVSPLGIALGLAAITRPEGLLIAGVFGLTALAQAWAEGRWRGWLVTLGWGAAVLVPQMAFRLAFYGDWVPNTFHAKVTGLAWARGFDYVLMAMKSHHLHPYAALAALGALALPWLARRRWPARGALVFFGLYLLYLVSIGGDYFEYRFLDVVGPIWALMVTAAALVVWRFEALPWPARSSGVVLVLAVALYGNYGSVTAAAPGNRLISTPEREMSFTRQFVEVGQWFGANLPPEESLAIRPAGAIAYYSGVRCLDLLGLNDRAIATEERFIVPGVAGHVRQVSRDHARERGVTYWVDHPRIARRPLRDGETVSVELSKRRWLLFEPLTKDAHWQPGVYRLDTHAPLDAQRP